MKNKVLIIVPTYNEVDNIPVILKQIYIQQEFIDQNKTIHVLVVDDNSPDGTADIVKMLQSELYNGKLYLLQREGNH